MTVEFRDKAVECISRSDLEKYQLAQLRKSVESALKTPFYKKRLKKAGISSADKIKTINDLHQIPLP